MTPYCWSQGLVEKHLSYLHDCNASPECKALQDHEVGMEAQQAIQVVGRHIICEQSAQQDISHHAHDIGHNVMVQLHINDARDPGLSFLQVMSILGWVQCVVLDQQAYVLLYLT